jgi:predicted DNA-binding transcriptional regulator AlpA
MLGSSLADISESHGAQLPATRRTLNLKQAAEYLGISRSHLLNIINGKVKGVPPLQPIRAGRRLLFTVEKLDQWLREAESKPASTDSKVACTQGEERC